MRIATEEGLNDGWSGEDAWTASQRGLGRRNKRDCQSEPVLRNLRAVPLLGHSNQFSGQSSASHSLNHPLIMAENRNFSPSQQKIIKRFYDNRDQLDEQKLAENVTNLYLATGEKQKAKIWKTVEEMMDRLGVPESRIKHILDKKDPAILAEVVKDLQSGKIQKPAPPAKPQP